jgi:hypothetical protein
MRRAEKRVNSLILTLNLQYIPGNYANNKKIADILQDEQNKFLRLHR